MKTATLKYDGHPDVVVTVSPVPLDSFYAVCDALDAVAGAMAITNFRALSAAFEPFVAGGLGAVDTNIMLAAARDWRDEVRLVPLPLPVRSSGGAGSSSRGPSRRRSRAQSDTTGS